MLAVVLLPAAAAAPTGAVDARFEGLRSAKGMLRICLTTNPDRFPDCKGDPTAITRSISAASPRLEIPALPAGDYAIAVVHDENGNGKLDTFAGIPREGVGFSRNPKLAFGPPRFAAAQFSVAGSAAPQSIRLKYFL
ncbi:DUF2141 domain-containing protein [Sphingomonas sanxanigenens]|uniref:DUF2141 domain-containing protein n=1 Tax=Sphingomonas sanxanigenens DSM 19645 = NX02 TaxID=1123269 RepID=W0A654_9SPHN|nr:DUF2141 domain-containing protein [Sphingomonas sanxanigenens]AHE51957.1 hypothetical protein NX02_00955 [Sphingomonas sanxanigenens DSM 19645 = NX02]